MRNLLLIVLVSLCASACSPTLHLMPMSTAPHDGTPIVVVSEIIDEGDFLYHVYWSNEDDTKGWCGTSLGLPWAGEPDDTFIGWIGTADDLWVEITGRPIK